MRRYFKIFSAITFSSILFVLTACNKLPLYYNNQTAPSPPPDILLQLDIDEFNPRLELEMIRNHDKIKTGSSIDLIIKNKSKEAISFEPGYGTRLLVLDKDKNEWHEISNRVKYIGSRDILRPKQKGDKNWVAYLTVSPEIPSDLEAGILRIGVVGKIMNDGTNSGKKVGNFLDVTLQK